MASSLEESLLERFRDELTYFRRAGARFAKRHPRVAKRLQLNDGPSPDPHVERLIEAVAFLTGKLQHNLESELPDVTNALLATVYPHFAQPVPAMAIAQFSPDEGGAGMTTGLEVPLHTKLYLETSFQRRTCRFRTCYPLTLWPIEVSQAGFESPNAFAFLAGNRDYANVQSVLRIRLKSNSEAFSVLQPDKLRFYIDGESRTVGALYNLLTTSLHSVYTVPAGQYPGRGARPQASQLRPCGFSEDEVVLPTHANGLRGYSLLQEYFSLPEKFLFVELDEILSEGAGEELDVLFLFDSAPRRKLSVAPETFRLGCSPVVNLFEKVSEPIYVDGKRSEYLLVPDARWERTTEVHSIDMVNASLQSDPEAEGHMFPLYGIGHKSDAGAIYWDARRRPSRTEDMPGSDVWLGFVDAQLQRQLPEQRTLRAHMLCTNRDLASHIDKGEGMYIEDGPHARVEFITRPTPQTEPPMQGEAAWRLVSHLSLSHTGLPEGETGVEALREQLRLYAFASEISIEPQLQSIVGMRKETVALRADDNAWRGFCRVQRITLTIDEERFGGVSPVMLGHVLSAYFGLHASVNVFTQLVLESVQREGAWYIWPPSIPPSALG